MWVCRSTKMKAVLLYTCYNLTSPNCELLQTETASTRLVIAALSEGQNVQLTRDAQYNQYMHALPRLLYRSATHKFPSIYIAPSCTMWAPSMGLTYYFVFWSWMRHFHFLCTGIITRGARPKIHHLLLLFLKAVGYCLDGFYPFFPEKEQKYI